MTQQKIIKIPNYILVNWYFNNFSLCYKRKYIYLYVETQRDGIH